MPSQKKSPNKTGQKKQDGLGARKAAWRALELFFHKGASLDDLLNVSHPSSPLSNLNDRDRAFARSIIMTGLRRKVQIDQLSKTYLAKRPPKKSQIETLLLITVVQSLFLDVPPHAAIDCAVTLAKSNIKSRPFAKLVNAVARKMVTEDKDAMVGLSGAQALLPTNLSADLIETYGKEAADQMANTFMTAPSLDLSVKANAKSLAKPLDATVIDDTHLRIITPKGRIESMAGYEDGDWWVQDFAASLPVLLLGNVRGQHIADLCAAPGGKTAQLCAKGAKVFSIDNSRKRLTRLAENMRRLDFRPDIVEADLATWQPEAPFDGILLDAPCSATGTMRRHPDIFHRQNNGDWLHGPRKTQKQMLSRLKDWLKPGGLVVYCTCSLNPLEGETQIDTFLDANNAFQRVPLQKGEYDLIAPEWITSEGDLRLLPHFSPPHCATGMDGFFAARLIYQPS